MKTHFLGQTSVGDTPRVVAVIAGKVSDFPDLAQKAKVEGADILEFRADFCTDERPEEIRSLLRKIKTVAPLPILLTIRQFAEGGYFTGSESFWGSESRRLSLFEYLLPEVEAVDIELYAREIQPAVVQMARSLNKFVVLSYHNFKHTPDLKKIDEIVEDSMSFGAHMVKIAVAAASEEDVTSLSRFTASFKRDILLTTISMGEVGVVSRVLNPFLGSSFTYGFVGQEPTTPGQIQVGLLRQLIDEFPKQRITDLSEAERLLNSAFTLEPAIHASEPALVEFSV
ncbi:MAG TPA: type I 3-dehydroquinate dehydratase [Verrucomicrobiae bacterium]|jgi:3-dehydroquinate dehydratase-1